MINEKQSKYFSIISIVIVAIFSVVVMIFPKEEQITNKVNNSSSTIEDVIDKESLMEINIDIVESDWDWLIENATQEEYRSANVTINGETFYNVGLRPKGNSSLKQVASNENSDRYSFKIDFDQYIDGQSYKGIEKLALNNNISDATSMKEYISYDIYNFLGIPTPEYSYAKIKVNNKDWGLYLALEVIDERYIEKNYGTLEGNLYKPETMDMGGDKNKEQNGVARPAGDKNNNMKPNGMPTGGLNGNSGFNPNEIPNGENIKTEDFQNLNEEKQPPALMEEENITEDNGRGNKSMIGGGRNSGGANFKYIDDNIESYLTITESAVFKSSSEEDFEKIVEMIKNLNEGTNLEKYLNVEEVLKYFAVNTYLVNLDSYSGGMYHNYYLYEKDGVFEILPWDLNMSFAGFSVGSGEKAVNFPIDSPVTGSLEDAPLIGKLLEVEEYKNLYHSYLKEIADGYFSAGTFENTVLKLDKIIGDSIKLDPTAFYNYEQYKSSLPELLNFGTDRTKSINAQLIGEQPSSAYGDLKTTVNLKSLGSQGMGDKNTENKGNNAIEEGNTENAFGEFPNPNGEITENFQKSNRGEVPAELNNKMGIIKNSSNIKNNFLILFSILGILIIAMLFIFKYKRKKYN